MKTMLLREWVLAQSESVLLDEEGVDHVTYCISSINWWYVTAEPLSDFLTAVVKNDLMEACGRADDINRKVLSIYAKYLHNCIPEDYKEKARNL